MNSLQTIPPDIFKGILSYLAPEHMAVLISTFSKRMIQLFALPGLISQLTFFDFNLPTRGDVLYLLRSMRSGKNVVLQYGTSFSENQLVALSRIPSIESLDIEKSLVIYDQAAISSNWSKAKGQFLNSSKWKIPSFTYNRMVVPDIGALFPNLKQVSFFLKTDHLLTVMRSLPESKAHHLPSGMFSTYFMDQLVSTFPKSLQRLFTRIDHVYSLPIPQLILSLPSELECLDLTCPFNTMISEFPNLSSFPHLSRLALTFQPSTSAPPLKPQFLPPTITELTLRPLWAPHALTILSGQWIAFKDLPDLEILNLAFGDPYRGRNPEIFKISDKIDLTDSLPLSIKALSIHGDKNSIRILDQIITGFPNEVHSLMLTGTSGGSCKQLISLTRSLPKLEVLMELTTDAIHSFEESQWPSLPPKLTMFHTYGRVFKDDLMPNDLPSVDIPAHTAPANPDTIKTPDTLLSQSIIETGKSKNLDESSKIAHSSVGVPKDAEKSVDLVHNTASGLPPLTLPMLPSIPPALRQLQCSFPISRLAIQFQRQFPTCSLKLLEMMNMDAATWRILLDEGHMAEDGEIDFKKLPAAFAALLPRLDLSVAVRFEALARVLELPHWAYIHTLVWETLVSSGSSLNHVFVQQVLPTETNFLKMINIKTLIINYSNRAISISNLPPLPPNLTKLQLLTAGLNTAPGASLPPSITDISMLQVTNPTRLMIGSLPEPHRYQFKKFEIPHFLFSVSSLISNLAPDATYVNCMVESIDHELPLLAAHCPNATLKLNIRLLFSGAYVSPPTSSLLDYSHIHDDTTQHLLKIMADSNGSTLTFQSCFLSGRFLIPDGVRQLKLDMMSGIALQNFEIGTLPPSMTSLMCHGSDLNWSMVQHAICSSDHLKLVNLTLGPLNILTSKWGQKPAQPKSNKSTANVSTSPPILISGKMLSLESLSINKEFDMNTSPKLTLGELECPNLKNLNFCGIDWLSLQDASIPSKLRQLHKLVSFEAESMQDKALFTLFEGHPSIQSVILSGTLFLSGALLPHDLEHLTWPILVSKTIEKLESQFKTVTYRNLGLETPLSLPSVLMAENSSLTSLTLTYDPLLPSVGRELLRSTPLTKVLPKLPLGLKSFEFSSSDPVKPLVPLVELVALLTPLKSLLFARIDCQIDAYAQGRVVFRLDQNLPPNLEVLHLPTAQTNQRTGVAFLPPPSLKEFHAPLLTISTRYLIPNTLQTLVVANSHQLQRQPTSTPTKTTTRKKRSKTPSSSDHKGGIDE